MTVEQIFFTIITILLTTLNVALTYYNFRHNKKKDFQDKLFQLKLEAYTKLNDACYEATRRLDINSSPFVEIYDFKDKDEWSKYCEANMGKQFHKGFETQELIYKYSLIIPSSIVDQYLKFTNLCIGYVTNCYHFDTGLIIDTEDRIWKLYNNLLNEFRKDIDIEVIDKGLRERIKSKM